VLTREQIEQRRIQLLAEESAGPLEWHWLSFLNPDLPEGSKSLGVVILQATGFLSAVELARQLGINPGGEVMGYILQEHPGERWLYRLIPPDEVMEIGRRLGDSG